jgi:hypothetical protein
MWTRGKWILLKNLWNAIILVIYMKNDHEKPWKVTNFQAKEPEFRVKRENVHLCIKLNDPLTQQENLLGLVTIIDL